jgi:hexosaminidase
MCAIADAGWTRAPKDWDAFTRRLEKHLGRLDLLGVGYCKAFYNPFIELHKDTQFSKIATISVDAPDAEIHYTLDGSTPTADSPVYTGPFVINPQQKVSAVAVRNGKALGEVKYKIF